MGSLLVLAAASPEGGVDGAQTLKQHLLPPPAARERDDSNTFKTSSEKNSFAWRQILISSCFWSCLQSAAATTTTSSSVPLPLSPSHFPIVLLYARFGLWWWCGSRRRRRAKVLGRAENDEMYGLQSPFAACVSGYVLHVHYVCVLPFSNVRIEYISALHTKCRWQLV